MSGAGNVHDREPVGAGEAPDGFDLRIVRTLIFLVLRGGERGTAVGPAGEDVLDLPGDRVAVRQLRGLQDDRHAKPVAGAYLPGRTSAGRVDDFAICEGDFLQLRDPRGSGTVGPLAAY